ncbi:MAG: hypothetical protein WBM34_16585, partial [Woeseiaceae bacterium]
MLKQARLQIAKAAATLFLCTLTLAQTQAAETLRKVTIGHDRAEELALYFGARGFDVLEGSVSDRELALIVSQQEYALLMELRERSKWTVINIERGQPL